MLVHLHHNQKFLLRTWGSESWRSTCPTNPWE